MITHALVEDGTDVILKRVDAAQEFRTGEPPVFTGKPFRWLAYTVDPDPVFDEDTQKMEAPVETVGADSVVRSRSVRALTPQEVVARTTEKIAALDETLTRIVEDVMVAIASGQPLNRGTFPAPVWAKVNARRRLRGEANI
jgi:hypothetical protein